MRHYLNKLFQICSKRRLWLSPLGKVGFQWILCLKTFNDFDPKKPNLLITAGFHGEEIAGPFAILKFLETSNILNKANFTFLPVVNPRGFQRQIRYVSNQRTNAGFCHPENGDKLSGEGEILMENIDLLSKSASDGFLSCHEDVNATKFYLYCYENCQKPRKFVEKMVETEKQWFDMVEDGTVVSGPEGPYAETKSGIVFNHCDGSFEDMLVHRGSTRSIVVETPAYNIALERRIDCGVALINKFTNLSVQFFNLE